MTLTVITVTHIESQVGSMQVWGSEYFTYNLLTDPRRTHLQKLKQDTGNWCSIVSSALEGFLVLWVHALDAKRSTAMALWHSDGKLPVLPISYKKDFLPSLHEQICHVSLAEMPHTPESTTAGTVAWSRTCPAQECHTGTAQPLAWLACVQPGQPGARPWIK